MATLTFYLSREAQRLGTDRELRRRHMRGALMKLCVGVYVDAEVWEQLDYDERYRGRVHAAALVSPPDVQFSHDSAAALWRLPSLGRWPSVSHQLTDPTPGGTSRVGIIRHGLGLDPNPFRIEGVGVASLARTLVDAAGSSNFARGVAMMDAGLRAPGVGDFRRSLNVGAPSKDELRQLLAGLLPYPASSRVERVIDFGTSLSGSVAESFGRVQFHALGLPVPELQVEFFDDEGSIGFADYYWRRLGLIGEVDGRSKYGANRKYRRDVPAEQILWEEKLREDRMRRVSSGFARLTWKRIADRRILGQFLGEFGLHPTR